MHGVHEVADPPEYLPAVHKAHDEASIVAENVPGLQSVHEVAPGAENFPAGQTVGSSSPF